MTNMELETDIEALDMEMGDITIHYCPVIPNPEGEPTAELKTADIEGTIYEIVDEEARTELENKVDKVEGKGLSENDYTDEDKAIVDGVTTALDGKVDKDGDKVLSDNNYSDTDKAIVDGVTEALNGKADKSDTYTKLEVDSALDNKVDKVGGKGLSANDFTDTLKDKLDGIEAEANKTVVDNSVTATSTNPVESKAIYNLLNDLLPEAEATGNPIAISNASGFNAKALTVDMLPIQDLHGYDSPWVGGGGKNKHQLLSSYDTNPSILSSVTRTYTDGEVSISGTTSSGNVQFYVEEISSILQSLGTATISLKVFSGDESNFQIRINIEENGSVVSRHSLIGTDRTYTYDSTKNYYLLMLTKNGIESATNLSLKCAVQIESGNQATSYSPYSNICPISGRTSLDVTVNGNTETISFGDTVYGGTSDVVNGGTSDEYGYTTVTSATRRFTGSANTYRYQVALATAYVFEDSDTNISNCVTGVVEARRGIPYTFYVGSNHTVYLDLPLEYDDTDKATQFITSNGMAICCKLATPTTINTPVTPISLNKGNNTLSTSGDNIDLKYSTTISNSTSLTMARPTLSLSSPTVAEPTVEEPTEE